MSAPKYRVTDALVNFVEARGLELSVTLVVQGTPIIGYLTSVLRDGEHTRRVFDAWHLVGNGLTHQVPDPVSAEETARIRAAWEEEHPEWSTEDYTFDRLCLRDATVRSGPVETWTRCHYLVVATDHVSAIALGFTEPSIATASAAPV
jgi:hypothetical protein